MLIAAGLALGDRAGLPARDPRYIAVFVVGVVATIVTDVTDKAFIAERRSERLLVRNLAFSAGKVALLAVPVFTSARALGLAWTWVLVCLASTLVSLWLLRGLGRGYRASPRGTRALLRPTLQRAAGHHLVSVGNLAPGYVLPLLVAGMLSATQSAYFYTTWRVGSVFFIVSAAVGTSLFAHASVPDADLWRAVRSSVKLIAGLLVPAVVFCALAGRSILEVFGPEYARHGYVLLLIMIVAALPDAVSNVYIAVLRVQRRLRFAAGLTAGMAVAAIAFAALLVGPYGIAGAGAGWLIGQSWAQSRSASTSSGRSAPPRGATSPLRCAQPVLPLALLGASRRSLRRRFRCGPRAPRTASAALRARSRAARTRTGSVPRTPPVRASRGRDPGTRRSRAAFRAVGAASPSRARSRRSSTGRCRC